MHLYRFLRLPLLLPHSIPCSLRFDLPLLFRLRHSFPQRYHEKNLIRLIPSSRAVAYRYPILLFPPNTHPNANPNNDVVYPKRNFPKYCGVHRHRCPASTRSRQPSGIRNIMATRNPTDGDTRLMPTRNQTCIIHMQYRIRVLQNR
jgi:hypothetical protein